MEQLEQPLRADVSVARSHIQIMFASKVGTVPGDCMLHGNNRIAVSTDNDWVYFKTAGTRNKTLDASIPPEARAYNPIYGEL